MPAYLITYDISDDIDRSLVRARIDGTYDAEMLSESSYAVTTSESPNEIYNYFEVLIGKKDSFFVIRLCDPWDGQGAETALDWLNRNLSEC